MRTLIISTGREKEILQVWYPSLIRSGRYIEDILLLDYDMEVILSDPHVETKKVEKVYKEIVCDRFRASYECLKDIWQNYDVIMLVDSDVEFLKPIAPLFEMAQEKLCYVKEITLWRHIYRFMDKEYWSSLEDERVINAGMIVGPAKTILEVTKFISKNLSPISSFGADQILFNALVYHYKTFLTQEVDDKWNYDIRKGIGTRRDIAILHKIGIGIYKHGSSTAKFK